MPSAVQTSPRKKAKQERALETVNSILRATAHILVRDGYEAASTNRIASKAGVSIGSLYQYFPNKEALVAALMDRHCDEMEKALFARAAEVLGQRAYEAVPIMVRAVLDTHRENPALHRVFVEQTPRVGKLCRMDDFRKCSLDLTRSLLEHYRGELRVHDLDVAAFVVVELIEALTHAALVHHPEYFSNDKLHSELTEMLRRYLLKMELLPTS